MSNKEIENNVAIPEEEMSEEAKKELQKRYEALFGSKEFALKKTRRENFLHQFEEDENMVNTIPNVAIRLMEDQFGVKITAKAVIPLVFYYGWNQVLKYVQEQTADEFSIDIAGVSLEYVTEYTESDKFRNIVPQLVHNRAPVFKRETNVITEAAQINQELLARYNKWRSVYLKETIAKIENTVYSELMDKFGVDLTVPEAVLPIMAATYAVGLNIAKETKQTVNMYNVFEIDVDKDDRIILTPLALIKQNIKNDAGKVN